MIKIGHLNVAIESKDLGPDTLGEFVDSEATIYLRPIMTDQIRRSTIVHESIHAISAIYNLELTETQVRVLESAMINLFQQNPSLLGKETYGN